MTTFVRKNIAVCTIKFTAADGTTTQPSAAKVVLSYKDHAGAAQQEVLDITKDSTDVWSVEWDTSAAGHGTVFWMAYGFGTLQAAAQGDFHIEANAANVV